jgi:hypothetical protein
VVDGFRENCANLRHAVDAKLLVTVSDYLNSVVLEIGRVEGRQNLINILNIIINQMVKKG